MKNATLRMMSAIAEVCPVVGLYIGESGNPASVRIDFDPAATAQQQAAAAAVVAAFDWSPVADATFMARRAKADATTFYDRAQTASADVTDRVVIAFAQLVLERFNFTAGKYNALLDAIDAAASLAALKTAVGQIADIPQLTQQQLVDAIKAKIAGTHE